MPQLLEACNAVVASGAFLLVTAHTAGIDSDHLEGAVREAFPTLARRVSTVPLELEAESGAVLQLGTAIRSPR